MIQGRKALVLAPTEAVFYVESNLRKPYGRAGGFTWLRHNRTYLKVFRQQFEMKRRSRSE